MNEIEVFLREAGVDQWGVAACPDPPWHPGMVRDDLLDFAACERQNASNIGLVGDICGICVAVCSWGR